MRLDCVAALLLTSTLAAAQEPAPSFEGDDWGLEPPGVQYLPAPGPRPHESRMSAHEPAGVRREAPTRGTKSALAGVPQGRERTGALSGKVVYLSPGHGFYRDSSLRRWATQRGNSWAVVEDLISMEVASQELLPMLEGAGATVIPVRETDLNPLMVIVDDGEAGYAESDATLFSTPAQPGWKTVAPPLTNATEPFTQGTTRVVATTSVASAQATWAPDVPADAAYNVYVSYGSDPTRATDAHYVVRHAGGESHFRVNQRRHGGTWMLLGRFFFRAGTHPDSGAVTLLNDSATPGATVSADAVRLGGGRGDVGDGTVAMLARPRSEESARYHVQFSGAPAIVYAPTGANGLGNERNADVSARPRFAAWLHEDGEDAVYVAWHTNASTTGNVVGTEGYVYGPNPVDGTYNFTGVPGSEIMARALLDEISRDMKREVDPNWKVRSLRSANLGEVNPTHNPEMPSVLLEMAYHDATADAAKLKEPGVRHVAARAIVQGLIKYFAARDSVAVSLPPEAPTAVVARTVAEGSVEVRWAAPTLDPTEEGRDGATGYRVYQSVDGLGWDEGTDVTGTSWVLPVAVGTVKYFRVAALNAGGESFPSATVGVRAGTTAAVLLVNAFERLDATMTCAEELKAYDLEAPVRVLIESMNDGGYLTRHGAAFALAAQSFDGATSGAMAAGLVSPSGYRVVDWFMGRGGVGGLGPSREAQDALRAFVLGGGHLLVSGTRVASALAQGSDADRAFLADILRASVLVGTPPLRVEGAPGDWLAGVGAVGLDDGTLGAYAVGTPEVLSPLAGGTGVLRYAGTGLGAGVASSPGGTVLFLGVPFEGLSSGSTRGQLVGEFLVHAGLLTQVPALPPPDVVSSVSPRPLTGCIAARAVDPHPVVIPPVDPPPTVREGLPQFYYGLGDSGCGCGAGGAGVGSGLWLLFGLIVHRRRARARTGHVKR
ncbi:N-acetylmuramoyl-L-alanine amidase [Corallococcus sp. H22C18031201]|nr:N-acetylmuramoyl-L-alanine amidase [Corallococcus sp. H22C18031201]